MKSQTARTYIQYIVTLILAIKFKQAVTKTNCHLIQ
jgi:hypothetical protein